MAHEIPYEEPIDGVRSGLQVRLSIRSFPAPSVLSLKLLMQNTFEARKGFHATDHNKKASHSNLRTLSHRQSCTDSESAKGNETLSAWSEPFLFGEWYQCVSELSFRSSSSSTFASHLSPPDTSCSSPKVALSLIGPCFLVPLESSCRMDATAVIQRGRFGRLDACSSGCRFPILSGVWD